MSDFNYQSYLKNNPLLQEEVKDQLITESQEVEEAEIPSSTVNKTNSEVTNPKTMAKAMLDFFDQIKEKETVDFEANVNMKMALDKLKKLANTEEKEEVAEDARTDAEQEGYKDGFDDAKDDVKDALSKMKVSELKAKIKETILAELSLSEAEEEDVELEDEVEDEVEIDIEEPASEAPAGLSSDEQEIQNSLKLAYDNAIAIGDQKLADQIGNSITFFTRTHVVER